MSRKISFHERLEYSRCINEIEGHNIKLVVSISGSERGLITIGRGYSDLPVAAGEVNLAELFGFI